MNDDPHNMAAEVAVGVLTELFKQTWSAVPKAGRWIIEKGKEYDVLGTAARRYADALIHRFDSVRVPGMERPAPLRSLYVNVNVLDKITETHRETVEALERVFDRDKRAFGHKRATKPGSQIISELDKFIVLGKPGAGKTTFLKYIMFRTLDGTVPRKRLPIFVSLKEFSETEKPIMDYVVDQLDVCRISEATAFVTRALEDGGCQLLLDGLDEVSAEHQRFVISQLVWLSDKYRTNQFVISCRIAAYNHCFPTFTDVELADFNDKQIEQFVLHWFASEPATGRKCWAQLRKAPPIRELACTPLLLALLCLAFDGTLGFPANRSELYKEALDALLKKWDASRRIERQEAYKHLSLRRKESLLCRLAAHTFEEGRYFIPQQMLERSIAQYVSNLPSSHQDNADVDSAAILRAIEAHHGILVQRAKGIYSFSHLTFQEYFTARYIVEHAQEGALTALVEQHMDEDSWREIILLTAEMLESADGLVRLMKRRVDILARSDGLDEIFTCLENLSRQEGTTAYPNALTRAIAVVKSMDVAHRTRGANTLDLRRAVGVLSRIDCELRVTRDWRHGTKDAPAVAELRRAIKRVKGDPSKMHMGPKAVSGLEAHRLSGYLKAYSLLLECLAADCYVSREVREEVTLSAYQMGATTD